MGLSTFAAWLGGELVYRKRVGVNHAETPEKPETWTAVLPEAELIEAQPKRIEVEGQPVLLYRRGGTVYALLATCSHAGGPLDEGKFYEGCVQCPWHDSVFALNDGHIVHGPATTPQPTYRARIQDGKVELRVDAPAQ
jgi:nitrite reductase/ring-hydroxylating ferredoxin subunit